MRDPVSITLSEDEKQLVDAAMHRSGCQSRSSFIRSASVLVAHEVLRRSSENKAKEEEEGER